MRWLALALLVVVAGAADAKRVVHIPTLGELCPGGPEWEKTATCFFRQGKHTILRDEAVAKVVSFDQSSRLAGVYVYTLENKRWRLRGEQRLYQQHELLVFQRVAFAKQGAYRLDVGFTTPTWVSADGETSVPALLRMTTTLVCFDGAHGCLQMMTACDTLVHGKALFSFRGTLSVDGGVLRVIGDRVNAGQFCVQPEEVFKMSS